MPGQSSGRDDDSSIYMPYGASGGGGAGGQYVFTDLDELDAVVTELETLTYDLREDGRVRRRLRR